MPRSQPHVLAARQVPLCLLVNVNGRSVNSFLVVAWNLPGELSYFVAIVAERHARLASHGLVR